MKKTAASKPKGGADGSKLPLLRGSRRVTGILIGCLMLISLVLAIYFVSCGESQIQKQLHPLRYSEIEEREAQAYELDPYLVYAVILAESNFDAQAVSHAGAMGLMQLMPATYEWLAGQDGKTETTQEELLQPEINVKYGCKFLAILLQRYEQIALAVAAYNAGPGNVDSWLENTEYAPDGKHLEKIPFSETEHYTKKVLSNYEAYQRLYQTQMP